MRALTDVDPVASVDGGSIRPEFTAGGERGAHGPLRGPSGDHGDGVLPPPGRRLRRLGLHLWGDGNDPATLAQVAWDKPLPPARIENGWATFEIPLTDDTKPVNFMVHQPSGDSVPETREPGGDRAFTPSTTHRSG